MNIAKQLYDRAAIDLKGATRHAWMRQEKSITEELDGAVREHGMDLVVDFLNDTIRFSESYEGRPPFFGDLFEAINDLRNDDYGDLREKQHLRDSQQFRQNVRNMGEQYFLHAYKIGEDGQSVKLEGSANPGAPYIEEPPTMLEEAMKVHQDKLRYAQKDGDESAATRAQNTIDLIRRDMDRLVPQPQLSPEQLQRQQATDQEYHDSVTKREAEHRAQLRSEPRDYEPNSGGETLYDSLDDEIKSGRDSEGAPLNEWDGE